MKLLSLAPVVATLLVSLGDVAEGGICPAFPLIRDFDFSKYTGLWYQQDKLRSGWEAPGRCWQSLYVRDATTGQYRMKIIYENTITGNQGMFESALTLLGPAKPSMIKYKIPYTFMYDQFQVLATDYETYSIEYQCDPNGILPKSENIFLLTREKTPPAHVLQKAYAIMHRYSIDIRKLERVDQTCGGLDLKGIIQPTELMRSDLIELQFGRKPQESNFADDELTLQGGHLDGALPGLEEAASSSRGVRVPDPNARRRVGNSPQPRHEEGPHPNDPRRRMAIGQSLATRLWHVLHTPIF